MNPWLNAKIRTKITIGLAVALLGLAGFAAILVVDKKADADASARVKTVSELSIRIGDLLHETQSERGRTAQFTSSSGTRFGAELTAQRKATDKRVAQLREFVADGGADLPAATRASVTELEAALDRLATLRSQTTDLATDPTEIISGYTELNQVLLATIATAGTENRNPTVAVRIQAYLALLSAKESAGLERAQLAGVFTRDRFNPGQLSTVISLIAEQRAYLNVFERAAGQDLQREWSRIRSSDVFAEVAGLETTAIERAASGGFGIDPGSWFDAATAKVNMFKELENNQATGILDVVNQARIAATRAARIALLVGIGLLVLAAGIGIAVVVSITRPLRQVTEIAGRMASGDVSGEVTYRSGNELGQLAESFRQLAGYMRETAALAAALAEGDLTRTAHPRGEQDLLGNAMAATVAQLSRLVGQIQVSGQSLSGSAQELTTVSSTLVANSEQTTSMATTVSAAADEMNSSITEISRAVTEAATVAVQAVGMADETVRVVTSLAEATSEIGGVVKLIQEIASQTNLLALNATIEAARAGEFGKGFAVVAEEVKQLAQQTAEATTSITARVGRIGGGAADAARVIAEMGQVVGRINDIATTISSAVEEQTVTTSEISRSMVAVAQAAGTNSEATNQSATSARELATMATALTELVSQFQTSQHGAREPALSAASW